MTYARPEDVRNRLMQLGNELSDTDLQDYLETAHRRIKGKLGKQFSDQVIIEDTNVLKYDTLYAPLLEFKKVKVEGQEISSDNYTVDKEEGTVTFDSTWADNNLELGQTIELKSVPEIYRDAEVLMTKKMILEDKFVMTGSEQKGTKVDKVSKELDALIKDINSKGAVVGFRDHRVVRI